MAGAADALQRDRDRARRAELHDEVDRADVDSEFERRRCDDRAQSPFLSRCSVVEANLARSDCRGAATRCLRRAASRARTRRARSSAACRRTPAWSCALGSNARRDRRSRPTFRCWRPARVRRAAPRPRASSRAGGRCRRWPDRAYPATKSTRRLRAAGSSPTSRCAAASHRPNGSRDRRAARALEPNVRRACRRPRRGSRRRSSVRTWLSSARDFSAVSKMKSDSGVVTSTCGGLRSMRARSAGVVSPVRTAVRIGASDKPCSAARASSSASGVSRFLRTSLVSALSGETYTTSVSSGSGPAVARFTKSSSAMVNAASVLPEPVGAETSTSRPLRMIGQAWTCGSVGKP